MAKDPYMEQSGIETGYWSKRKEQFNKDLAKGIGFDTPVRNKPKHKTATKATEKPNEKQPILPVKKDLLSTPPNQLKGKDFAERMRLAREAKQKS